MLQNNIQQKQLPFIIIDIIINELDVVKTSRKAAGVLYVVREVSQGILPISSVGSVLDKA